VLAGRGEGVGAGVGLGTGEGVRVEVGAGVGEEVGDGAGELSSFSELVARFGLTSGWGVGLLFVFSAGFALLAVLRFLRGVGLGDAPFFRGVLSGVFLMLGLALAAELGFGVGLGVAAVSSSSASSAGLGVGEVFFAVALAFGFGFAGGVGEGVPGTVFISSLALRNIPFFSSSVSACAANAST
jgi:hypothetical protein